MDASVRAVERELVRECRGQIVGDVRSMASREEARRPRRRSLPVQSGGVIYRDYFRVVRSTCRRLPCCSAVKIRFRRFERVGSLSVVDAASVWPFQCGGNSYSSRAANLSKFRNSYKVNHWRASARLRRFTKVAGDSAGCR